jgi:hypothetical protein
MNFAQQLATDLSNVVKTAKAGGKPKARAKAASAPQATASKPRATRTAKGPQATPPAPQATASKAAPAPQAAPTRYALGKAFVAKASGKYAQAENWAVVAAMLPATREDLIAVIIKAAEVGGYADRCNAVGFVQGRVRGGNIVVAE